MPLAFTGGADFSGITPGGLLIDNVIHAGCVEVDEVGTVAAAATLVIIYESERPLFRVDHPFLFLIRDTQTGDLCFIGRCVNPIVD
jgi:serpin B